MQSITKVAEEYVNSSPSIKEALKNGLVNYSKLSRKIINETKIKPREFDAILVALRRYERKLAKKKGFERDLKKLLAGTRLEIHNKIMVCILEKGLFGQNIIGFQKEAREKTKQGNDPVQIIEGVSAITLITSQELEKDLNKYFKNRIIKKTTGLISITLKTSENLEEVPGFMGHICSMFAEKDINIVEMMSCWTDTIFVIEAKDLEKTVKMLSL